MITFITGCPFSAIISLSQIIFSMKELTNSNPKGEKEGHRIKDEGDGNLLNLKSC
jgi:hypothetical protein